MKNKEEFKKELSSLLRKYKKKLLISKSWKVRYKISKDIEYFAVVEYEYSKREFIININVDLNMSKEQLKDTVIHELFHIFLSPYVDECLNTLEKVKNKKKINYAQTIKKLDRIEEKIVTKLTKIVLNLEIEYAP